MLEAWSSSAVYRQQTALPDRQAALIRLNDAIVDCTRCPRLAAYIREVALVKRRSFIDEEYWGRPLPNFGDPRASIIVVGLAPAAHGGNRTGRMFTGDESGNWLFRAMFEAGLASQPNSTHIGDGLTLSGALITAAAHCAPPANKPTIEELATCRGWLIQTMQLAPWKVLVALGRIAYEQSLVALNVIGEETLPKRSQFGHGACLGLSDGRAIVCSYHPSQHNTFTGKLTREMLSAVFEKAVEIASG